MYKNKKGFTLFELMMVFVIIGILAAVSVPAYRTATMKTRIVNNMGLMNALQSDLINFYNLHGELPSRIVQLSINKGEFGNITNTSATHLPSRCTITLNAREGTDLRNPNVSMDCGTDWIMIYEINSTSLGYTLGERRFSIRGSSSNADSARKIASELGWDPVSRNLFIIR